MSCSSRSSMFVLERQALAANQDQLDLDPALLQAAGQGQHRALGADRAQSAEEDRNAQWLGSYFTFFMMHRFQVSVGSSQLHLFLFLGAVAPGTLFGGPIGVRIGRKPILWISIRGVLPLTLARPFADLFWTDVLAVLIGLTMASAFPAIVVYAQQLLPGRVGMIGGLF